MARPCQRCAQIPFSWPLRCHCCSLPCAERPTSQIACSQSEHPGCNGPDLSSMPCSRQWQGSCRELGSAWMPPSPRSKATPSCWSLSAGFCEGSLSWLWALPDCLPAGSGPKALRLGISQEGRHAHPCGPPGIQKKMLRAALLTLLYYLLCAAIVLQITSHLPRQK